MDEDTKRGLILEVMENWNPPEEHPLCRVLPGGVRYNYPEIGRALFPIQKLPNALPIYEKDPDIATSPRDDLEVVKE